MSNSADFRRAFREWSETYMKLTMHEMIRISKETGLSLTQLSSLLHIYHGNDCGVSTIGDHLGVTNAAASQMIDRLVQHGFVTRSEDSTDRRVKNLKLTEKGKAIVQGGIAALHRQIENLMNTLTIEEQETIIFALNLLTNSAREIEEGALNEQEISN